MKPTKDRVLVDCTAEEKTEGGIIVKQNMDRKGLALKGKIKVSEYSDLTEGMVVYFDRGKAVQVDHDVYSVLLDGIVAVN